MFLLTFNPRNRKCTTIGRTASFCIDSILRGSLHTKPLTSTILCLKPQGIVMLLERSLITTKDCFTAQQKTLKARCISGIQMENFHRANEFASCTAGISLFTSGSTVEFY